VEESSHILFQVTMPEFSQSDETHKILAMSPHRHSNLQECYTLDGTTGALYGSLYSYLVAKKKQSHNTLQMAQGGGCIAPTHS
jgi:hypothetical protein